MCVAAGEAPLAADSCACPVQGLTRNKEPFVRLRLRDSPYSRALWDHAFELEYEVRLGGRQLGLSLTARNTGTGDAGFTFTAALHSYLGVVDVHEEAVMLLVRFAAPLVAACGLTRGRRGCRGLYAWTSWPRRPPCSRRHDLCCASRRPPTRSSSMRSSGWRWRLARAPPCLWRTRRASLTLWSGTPGPPTSSTATSCASRMRSSRSPSRSRRCAPTSSSLASPSSLTSAVRAGGGVDRHQHPVRARRAALQRDGASERGAGSRRGRE